MKYEAVIGLEVHLHLNTKYTSLSGLLRVPRIFAGL